MYVCTQRLQCTGILLLQMNNGMIRGSDVRVEIATRENGYVELTPEAAKNPWAVIGKFSSIA